MLCFPAVHQAQTRYTRQYISVAGKKRAYETFGLANRRPGDPILLFEAGFAASGSLNFTHLFPALSKFAAGLIFIDGPDFMLTMQQDEEIKQT